MPTLSRPTKKGPWFVRVSEIDPVAIAAVVVRPSPDSHPKTRAVAPMVHRDRYCDAPGADDGSCASRRPGVQRQYRRRTGNPGANYPDLCRGSAKRFDIHDHYCRSAPRLLILMARIRAKPLRRVTSLLGNRGLQPGTRVEFGIGCDHPREQHRRAPPNDRRTHHALRQTGGPRECEPESPRRWSA